MTALNLFIIGVLVVSNFAEAATLRRAGLLRGNGSHKEQDSNIENEKKTRWNRALSSDSAGEIIASIAICSICEESWVAFDNSESEKACYGAISSYISNYLPNDIRSYYYTRMTQATTTWFDKLTGMTINQIEAGKCSNQDFNTIKNQLITELSSLRELISWQNSMVDYITATATALKSRMDGVQGIMQLETTNVISPPSGLPTWAKVFMGVVEIASAAAPEVLTDKSAIDIAQGAGDILKHVEARQAGGEGSGSSPDNGVSVAYDTLVGTTLPDSFKDMANTIKAQFKTIAEDCGKLLEFNKLVYTQYPAPGNINFANTMGAKGFQDIYGFQAWSMLFPVKYGICYQSNMFGSDVDGSCVSNFVANNMKTYFDDSHTHYWVCEHSHPNLVPPTQVLDAIKGNSFVIQKGFGSYLWGIALLISAGSENNVSGAIAEMALLCSSAAPSHAASAAKGDGYTAICAEFAKSMTFSKLDDCQKATDDGCEGIASASAGDIIGSIASCSAYQAAWVSFDNDENEKACYGAISSYISNYLPNDLRSYYYTRMTQATTTWFDKLTGMTINQIEAGKCSSQDFNTIKNQLITEFSSLSELSSWQDSMVDYITATTSTLKNHLDGVQGIIQLKATNVIPPPGLHTWAKVFLGFLQLASAAAPAVLTDKAAINIAQGAGAVLKHVEANFAGGEGSGSSPDNSGVSVAYDSLVCTTLPVSFKDMADTIKVQFKTIAENYGKLKAFNELVYKKYPVPGKINFADMMGAKGFQDIYEFQAWSMLFPVKYGICYQWNEYGSDVSGSCVSNDVPNSMKTYFGDSHTSYWVCEHSHPNLVPPTQVLDAIKGNSFVIQKGFGSYLWGIALLISAGSENNASAAIAEMALLCSSAAPSDAASAFKGDGYTATCAEFAKSMTFSKLDDCQWNRDEATDPGHTMGRN